MHKEKGEVLVDVIVKAMQDKKAKNIVSLDLRDISNSVTDFFVICHGDSSTQVDSIAKGVEEESLKQLAEKPWHAEGKTNSKWILLDYVNVVVHVFYKEEREFYNIEMLWADAKIESFEYQL